jgi:hypothetical protein
MITFSTTSQNPKKKPWSWLFIGWCTWGVMKENYGLIKLSFWDTCKLDFSKFHLPYLHYYCNVRGAGQEECERVWGWRLILPSEFPFWKLESRWTLEPSKSDCRGQNTSHWRVIYIIGKILKCRCLKWLAWPIWTFETQVMAKRKVRNQTGSLIPNHEMSGIDPISVRAGGVWYTVGKLSMRATTLLYTSSWLEVWARNYSFAKLREF